MVYSTAESVGGGPDTRPTAETRTRSRGRARCFFAEPFGPRGVPMSEVTRILSAIDEGDPHAAGQLLPLVYDELRRLAAQKLAAEKPGQTLQATALVHEAYLRLVDGDQAQHWNGKDD